MKRFYILFLILFLSCSSIDDDIPFSYSVDTLNVEIGYPVSFNISVNNLEKNYTILEQGWADSSVWISDSSRVFIKSATMDSLENSYSLNFEITFWDTGKTIIPPYFLTVNSNDSTISETYNSDYIDISVRSSLSDGDLTDIQPDKPIKEVELPYNYKKFIILFIIIFLLFYAIYLWNNRDRIRPFFRIRFFNQDPKKDAIEAINKIISSNTSSIEFYESLSRTLKEYIQNEYYIIAHEMTSVELNKFFNDRDLADLLNHIDSVKFASKDYSSTERKKDLALAKKFVRKLL
ncbi:MAG: hypothetical protein VX176_01200 [Candidatus Neomarinimicrobiota bacterium]|nr:hypothetical protein [Candidatus Neomarinimicrobiota bacterium]MEE3241936.1 hypothetical protein [Candidatus Neomarinimicrobiota bacterium]MEE3301666.1 hypothetical protein [Candidatus Neomarinimicrobiota bacterium]